MKRHLLLAGRHWWICKFFHSTSGYHQYACNVNQRKLITLNKHDGLSSKPHHIHSWRNAEAGTVSRKFLKAVSKELWKYTGYIKPKTVGNSKASALPHSYITLKAGQFWVLFYLNFQPGTTIKKSCKCFNEYLDILMLFYFSSVPGLNDK